METVQFQSYVFLYSVYGGILIGILYDIYRAVKGKKRNEKLITSLWDVLFLISVFVVVIWAIFSSSYGDIRAYVFIGFVVGFYLFEKLLGRIAVGIFCFICRSIGGFLRRTNFILALPIKLLCSFLYRCGRGLVNILRKGKSRLKKIRKLPKQIVYDYKKYNNMIVKRKGKKNQIN